MEQNPAPLVHWYDTAARRIACDAPGQMGSTKHMREVTCAKCLVIIRQRAQDPV